MSGAPGGPAAKGGAPALPDHSLALHLAPQEPSGTDPVAGVVLRACRAHAIPAIRTVRRGGVGGATVAVRVANLTASGALTAWDGAGGAGAIPSSVWT